MYKISTTKQFDKDLKRVQKGNKNLNKLWSLVKLLSENKPLQNKYHKHKLAGFSKETFECHIEANWLLIWIIKNNELILIRTGSHADLF